MIYAIIPTPIGGLMVARNNDGAIAAVRFRVEKPDARWHRDDDAFGDVRAQLDGYFSGARRRFDLELAPEGTPFQLSVWEELQRIPFGSTRTYADIARAIGKPSACRAVGAANGANPIPIFIPCHRVIGSDGSLTGFGGGIDIKRRLLALESIAAAPLFAKA